jgi:photosystem II stability/assembly factor-like uncharacterized protein
MKLKLAIPALALVCGVTTLAQNDRLQLRDASQKRGFPASDTAYKSTYVPKLPTIEPGVRIKDDATARREWMKERMGGPLSSDARDAMLAQIAALRAKYPGVYGQGAVKPGASGTWTSIGPARSKWIQNDVRRTKSDTGRIRTILVHPSNADIVYLLTSGGGLWKTTNFLSPRPAWEPKSDAIGVAGGAVAFGADPNTILLGFGDSFDGGVGGFLRKSTDGGTTWGDPKPLGSATVVNDIDVDGSTVFVGTTSGLWRSTDGGDSFAPAGPTSTPFGVSTHDHPAFWVWSVVRTNGAWLASYDAGYGAIYRSTDGVTWTASMPFSPTNDIGRITLAVAEPGDPVVYAFASNFNSNAQKDLFRSTDGGQTWTALGLAGKTPVNPTEYQSNMDIMAGQAWYNQMLLVDPADAERNTVYIGGQFSSAKTTDGGDTWRVISDWLALDDQPYVHADFHTAAYSPATRTILFGTDGGLFTSSDGGRTFSDQKNDGIGSYLVYALATNEKHTDDALIGLQDNGTRLRVGKSTTYNQVFGGDGFGVGWSEGVAIGSIYYSFMFRTPLGNPATENKWFVGYNGILEDEFFNPALTQFITTIYQPSRKAAPDGRTFYHRSKYTLYKTTDAAANWTPIFQLPRPVEGQPLPPEFRGVTHPIGVGWDNQDEIAVAMSGGNVAISTDGGDTFRIENLNAPRIPGYNTFSTAVAWANRGELFVSTENPDPAAAHLVRSRDAGVTWERVDAGLPAVPVSRIYVDPRDPNTIYVGTWVGVFVSKDSGGTWAPLGAGLPLAMVNDIYMPEDGSFIRVASYGRGVWDYRF